MMAHPLTITGGWHSKLEKQALKSRSQNAPSRLIFFLAKGIDEFTLPQHFDSDFHGVTMLSEKNIEVLL